MFEGGRNDPEQRVLQASVGRERTRLLVQGGRPPRVATDARPRELLRAADTRVPDAPRTRTRQKARTTFRFVVFFSYFQMNSLFI